MTLDALLKLGLEAAALGKAILLAEKAESKNAIDTADDGLQRVLPGGPQQSCGVGCEAVDRAREIFARVKPSRGALPPLLVFPLSLSLGRLIIAWLIQF